MAIIKNIKKDNGSETNYHKIKNISIKNDNGNITCKFEICNYKNEEYRNKDKSKGNVKEKIFELRQKLDDVYKIENYDESIANKIIKELNEYEKIYYTDDYYSISTDEIIIENTNISLNQFYDLIKELDNYKNSKDY